MSVLDDVLAALDKRDVSDDEIKNMLKAASDYAEAFSSNAEVAALFERVRDAAMAKMNNKDVRFDESGKPLEGFNVAYDLAQRGEHGGFADRKPMDVLAEIADVKNRATALNAASTSYDHQAVASDLLRATHCVEPSSPEVSVKMLKMEKELFDGLKGSGHSFEAGKSQLEIYNHAARYFGDEKVADAYMAGADKALYKVKGLDLGADGLVENTMKKYTEVAAFHPKYAEECFDAGKYVMREVGKEFSDPEFLKQTAQNVVNVYDALANNPRVDPNIRKQAQNAGDLLKRKYALDKETNAMETTRKVQNSVNDKQKAQDFVQSGRSYSGGNNLFDRVKKFVKDDFKKTFEFAQNNPKALMGAGAAAMFTGMGTANPALAAAGAAIMTYGFCRQQIAKVKQKMNPAQETTEVLKQNKKFEKVFDGQMFNKSKQGGR